jgi:hypothetical protein
MIIAFVIVWILSVSFAFWMGYEIGWAKAWDEGFKKGLNRRNKGA